MSATTGDLASTHGHGESYLTAKSGIASWLLTVDHKRIGIMYMIGMVVFFLVAAGLAIAALYLYTATAAADGTLRVTLVERGSSTPTITLGTS